MITVRDVVALAIQRLDHSTNFTCIAVASAVRALSHVNVGYNVIPAVHMWVGFAYVNATGGIDTFPDWWGNPGDTNKGERKALLQKWADKHGDVVLYV